ncbi:MAG: hypothetical protein V1725_06685 [archaeon]
MDLETKANEWYTNVLTSKVAKNALLYAGVGGVGSFFFDSVGFLGGALLGSGIYVVGKCIKEYRAHNRTTDNQVNDTTHTG